MAEKASRRGRLYSIRGGDSPVTEAVGPDAGLARLIRDRDKIFGVAFDGRVDNLGLTQLRIAARSPWQNGFAERWVGTARREIVDHVIVLSEHHLRRILREYIAYYNADRPHMSLGATRRCDAMSSHHRWAVSSRCRTSAGSIIATGGSPRERVLRHDTLVGQVTARHDALKEVEVHVPILPGTPSRYAVSSPVRPSARSQMTGRGWPGSAGDVRLRT